MSVTNQPTTTDDELMARVYRGQHCRAVASPDGDTLIYQGRVSPTLYYSKFAMPTAAFFKEVHECFQIRSINGVSFVATMIETEATFMARHKAGPPSATFDDVCLMFQLSNGTKAIYTSRQKLLAEDGTWLRTNGFVFAAGPSEVSILPGANQIFCDFLTAKARVLEAKSCQPGDLLLMKARDLSAANVANFPTHQCIFHD